MRMQTLTGDQIGQALQGRVRGQVLIDDKSLSRHSTDWSIYQIRPLAVVVPQDVDDIVALVRFAREEHIPLTARGGGSSTSGSALGRGIMVALNRTGPLARIVDFGQEGTEPHITVEPGLLHDELQRFLRGHGLYLPADPSSGGISMLGGNIATKASGPHAYKHGSIDRYLRHLQFVTIEGEVVDTAEERTIPERIRQGVQRLRDEVLADGTTVMRLDRRKDMKLASGYNLFTFLRDRTAGDWVAQLLVGSVGTLGIVTRATLRAEPYVEGHAAMLLYFRSLYEAGDAVQHLRPLGVAAIEIISHSTLQIVKSRNPDVEIPDGEAHMLMVEVEGPERLDLLRQVERAVADRGYALAWPTHILEGEEEQSRMWKVRKALFPTLTGYRPDLKPLSVVNDVGVEESHLADFIREVEAVFARHGLVAAIYGHAGSGNLHLRPLFSVTDPDLPALIRQVADEVYEIVLRHNGTITAEHGMGRLRTPYLSLEWGESITGYMRRVKEIFDPGDLLNPEVMFGNRPITDDMKPLG